MDRQLDALLVGDGPVLVAFRRHVLDVHEVGDVVLLQQVLLVLQLGVVVTQPVLHGVRNFDVILFVWTRVEIERGAACAVMVRVVHEHHLAIAVRVHERQELDAVHLEEELAHVGAREGGEKDELEVDALHVGLHDAQLMLEKLEQNVILVQVQVEESFQIGVVEVSEKYIGIERQSVGKARLLDVELALLVRRPKEECDVLGLRPVSAGDLDPPFGVHLVVGFLEDAFYVVSHLGLVFHGPLKEIES